jgi:hypothetical protein
MSEESPQRQPPGPPPRQIGRSHVDGPDESKDGCWYQIMKSCLVFLGVAVVLIGLLFGACFLIR